MPTRRSLVSPGEGQGSLQTAGGLERTDNTAGKSSTWTFSFFAKWSGSRNNLTLFAGTAGDDQIYTESGSIGTDLSARADGNFAEEATNSNFTKGSWHHVHIVYENGVKVSIRVDGGTEALDSYNTFPEREAIGVEFGADSAIYYLLQDDGADGDWDGRIFDFIAHEGVADTNPENYNFDAATGEWKEYTGPVGDFGFRIDGQNESDAGEDSSGNGNHFTQSTGGGAVSLDEVDVPLGANPAEEGANADLAAVDGADSASFAAEALVQANLAATEVADAAAFSAQLVVQADLAATEGADAAAFGAQLVVQVDLAASEGADVAEFSATVTDTANADLAAVEGADAAAFSASAPATATLAATEGADVAAFAAQVLVQATLAATEGADTAAFTSAVLVSGDLAAIEGADVAAFVASAPAQADVAVVEGADVAAFAAAVPAQADLATVEGADTAAFTADVVVQADLAAVEGADLAAFSVSEGSVATANLAAVEGPDAAAFTAAVLVQGELAAAEGADVAAFAAQAPAQADLAATEGADLAAFTASVGDVANADLAAVEGADVAAFAANVVVSGDLVATEGADAAAFASDVLVQADLAATEGADIAAFLASIGIEVSAEDHDARIYEALMSRLDTLGVTPALPIAHEGRSFTRPTSGGYIEARVMRGQTRQATTGPDPELLWTGSLEATVVWPENQGAVLPLEVAGQIIEHFKIGTDITREGVTVTVRGPPWPGPTMFEAGWSKIPVSIPYWSHGRLGSS